MELLADPNKQSATAIDLVIINLLLLSLWPQPILTNFLVSDTKPAKQITRHIGQGRRFKQQKLLA